MKKYLAVLQSLEDPSRRQRFYETSRRHHDLLSQMEEVIAGYSVSLTSISDEDVYEAVISLKSTYRTEQKGVIYEHASSNPLAQALVKELRSFLEKYRARSAEEGVSLRTGDLVACLEFLEVDVGHHLANESGRDSYLQFIARSHPDAVIKESRGGIILAR